MLIKYARINPLSEWRNLEMDKKSTGPYKHYERPTEKRSSQDNPSGGSTRWIAVIVILAVILIALIPVVHRLAVSRSEKADEVQTVQKVS